jgi:hypothetical protein
VRRGRRAAGLLCAVALAGAAGCGDGGGTAAPAGLRVTVEQSRDNENRGLLQLVVHNDGAEPVQVRRAQLRSPAYRAVPGAVFDEQVRPGTRTAFPVRFGDAVCDVEGAAGSVVVLGLREGGSVREARLPVPDGDPVLPRLHARACALERLERSAELEFSTGWVRDGDVVTGELVLRRRQGAPAADVLRVTAVQSSILFLLQPLGTLPVELAAADRRASLPVRVTAVRCDPHARIESKRSYTFPVFVAVGDAEPLQVQVTADDGGSALMDSVLRDRCDAADDG